jgi:hypothetical protein
MFYFKVRIQGHFSPCGTFVYSGTWDIRSITSSSPAKRSSIANIKNGSVVSDGDLSSRERGSPEAKGVYIWRVATAQLERVEMRALHNGTIKMPVTVCRWYVPYTKNSYPFEVV